MSGTERERVVVFGGLDVDFQGADRRYAELKRLYDTGHITSEGFCTLVLKESMGRDAQGRWWVKSCETGEWHYHEGSTWKKGNPPDYQPVGSGSQQEWTQGPPGVRTKPRKAEPERQVRWNREGVLGAVAAVFAGVAWVAEGILVITASGDPVDAMFIAALIGTLGGLVGLHARQALSYGRLGLAGLSLSFAGIALWILGFVSRPDWLPPLAVLSMLVVGFVLLGVATLRARALPRWCAVALLASPVFFYLPFEGNGIVLGLVWLAVGWALWPQRHAPAGQPGGVG